MMRKPKIHIAMPCLLLALLSLILSTSLSAQVDAAKSQRASMVDAYFAQPEHHIKFRSDYVADGNTAFQIADRVALFVDLQDPDMPLGITVLGRDNTITLHPDTFIGGAIRTSDPSAENPEVVSAAEVARVIAFPADYRELCGFEHQVGGSAVAGTIQATLGSGETVTLGAEVGTSMIDFEERVDAAEEGGVVISWPNSFCKGVKRAKGSCKPLLCGMTLGDMIDLAGEAGVPIPTSILADGVDAVAEWLTGLGYVVSGTCGSVSLIFPPIPLGCQCIYVQF